MIGNTQEDTRHSQGEGCRVGRSVRIQCKQKHNNKVLSEWVGATRRLTFLPASCLTNFHRLIIIPALIVFHEHHLWSNEVVGHAKLWSQTNKKNTRT